MRNILNKEQDIVPKIVITGISENGETYGYIETSEEQRLRFGRFVKTFHGEDKPDLKKWEVIKDSKYGTECRFVNFPTLAEVDAVWDKIVKLGGWLLIVKNDTVYLTMKQAGEQIAVRIVHFSTIVDCDF